MHTSMGFELATVYPTFDTLLLLRESLGMLWRCSLLQSWALSIGHRANLIGDQYWGIQVQLRISFNVGVLPTAVTSWPWRSLPFSLRPHLCYTHAYL